MPDGFWWTWWVALASAVATFLAVLVALFGQSFRAKFFPPLLSLRLVSHEGELTTVQLSWRDDEGVTHGRNEEARYYHVCVSNARRWSPATQVQLFLTQVEELGPDGSPQVKWVGAAPFQWRHQEIYPPARTIGADADSDLCHVVKEKWLELHLLVTPFNLEAKRTSACDMILTLQARANEADSPVEKIRLAWNGKWDSGSREMRQHLAISHLQPSTYGR